MLRRHNVGEYCSDSQALQAFHLETFKAWSMRVRYQCVHLRNDTGSASVHVVTQASEDGNGDTMYIKL
jgi:hypothetical protein